MNEGKLNEEDIHKQELRKHMEGSIDGYGRSIPLMTKEEMEEKKSLSLNTRFDNIPWDTTIQQLKDIMFPPVKQYPLVPDQCYPGLKNHRPQVSLHVTSSSYEVMKAGNTFIPGGDSTTVYPSTQEEKEILTGLVNGNINQFIGRAKEEGNYLSAKGISDGYHTFQELYDMRLALTVALFHQYYQRFFLMPGLYGSQDNIVMEQCLIICSL